MLGFLLGGAPPGNGPSMKTKVVTNLEGQQINLCNCVTELKKSQRWYEYLFYIIHK